MFGWFITVFMVGFVLGVVFERMWRSNPRPVWVDLTEQEVNIIEREWHMSIVVRRISPQSDRYELMPDPTRGTSNDDVQLAIARARTESAFSQSSI